MRLLDSSLPPSFQDIFTVGRVLKKGPLEPVAPGRNFYGIFLIEDGEAKMPGFDLESGLHLVTLLHALVDGHESQDDLEATTALETFIELSIFDPYDVRPTSFYFLLLSYSRHPVDSYITQMRGNIDQVGESNRGLIIPDERTYREPKYTFIPNDANPIFARKRSDKPTLYMGLFPTDLNDNTVEPTVKVPAFLSAVSVSLRDSTGGSSHETIQLTEAFLLTFPRPVGPNPGSESEFLRGGGLFVFGNYKNERLGDRQMRIQSRLMKQVMKVSHTQADAFLMVEETEKNGRAARSHELRSLIVHLDQKIPKCIFDTIKEYFKLVVSFEHLEIASPKFASLQDMIFRAANKACEMAIANKYCMEEIGQDWVRDSSGDVLLEFAIAIGDSTRTLDIKPSPYPEWEHLEQADVERLFMALVCLFRNVFLHGKLELEIVVDLKPIEDCVAVCITNFTNKPTPGGEAKSPICNTKQAGQFYVSEMRQNPKFFDFRWLGFNEEKQAMGWFSTCPLPRANPIK